MGDTCECTKKCLPKKPSRLQEMALADIIKFIQASLSLSARCKVAKQVTIYISYSKELSTLRTQSQCNILRAYTTLVTVIRHYVVGELYTVRSG